MPVETLLLVRPLEAGQPHRASGHQLMHIGADADAGSRCHRSIMPHGVPTTACRDDDGEVTSSRFHGALAAAAALAASQLVAALLGLRESPVLAIAQTAIRLTPGQVAEPIIGAVGTADKPLAIVAVV